MSKVPKRGILAERPNTDFSKGVRGKYFHAFADSNVVVVDSDLTEAFPDSKAVNKALRTLKELAARSVKQSKATARKRVAA